MRQSAGVFLAALLFFGACAWARTESARRIDAALYERHTLSGDWLRLHWNLSRTDQGVTAEGYAENIGDSLTRVKWIRLWLVGYDREDREVLRSQTVRPFPNTLLSADNISIPTEREIYGTFRITLPNPDGATRFDIVAEYFWDIFPQGDSETLDK